MRQRYVLAPEAVLDLDEIWMYIRRRASTAMADRVEAVIREKIYQPETKPLQIVAILHGRRDPEELLKDRV